MVELSTISYRMNLYHHQSSSPAQWCRAFFILFSVLVLGLMSLPDHSSRELMGYGARQPVPPTKDAAHVSDTTPDARNDRLLHLVRKITSRGQVPHKWFVHFYLCSLAWSLFWAWQLVRGGDLVRGIAALQADGQTRSMSSAQVLLLWTMMVAQASRRLYECLWVLKPSGSRMWFVHWLLGLGFYTFVNISVWVEGSPALLSSNGINVQDMMMTLASPRTAAALAIYVIGCFQQNRCHRYLAGLKKYTLPEEGWFKWLVCPHYTAECLIYMSMALAGAPQGSAVNKTLFSALLFVATNLGATGKGTKRWYAEKFGMDKVAGSGIMVPFIY